VKRIIGMYEDYPVYSLSEVDEKNYGNREELAVEVPDELVTRYERVLDEWHMVQFQIGLLAHK
jgi:hypothetical protein